MSYETSTLQMLTYEGDIVSSWMFLWTHESKNVGILHIDKWGDVSGHKTLPRETAKSLFLSLREKGACKVPSSAYLPVYKASIKYILERI